MNPIKEQLSQLVQDVIDGNESAVKANDILIEIKSHVNKCQNEIDDLVTNEMIKQRHGSDKTLNE